MKTQLPIYFAPFGVTATASTLNNQSFALSWPELPFPSNLRSRNSNAQRFLLHLCRLGPSCGSTLRQPARRIVPSQLGDLEIALFVRIGFSIIAVEGKVAIRSRIDKYLRYFLRLRSAEDFAAQ